MATLSLRLDPRQMETGADRGEKALDDVKRKAVQTESAVDRLGTSFTRSGTAAAGMAGRLRSVGGAFRGARGQIQNASFQIADFATQVGSGTSATIALGQQLPQLLGGFGALGAALSAVVAIGVPLAAFFFSSADGAKELGEAIKGIGESTKAARDELALLQSGLASIDQLRIQEEINRLKEKQAQINSQIEAGSIRISGVSSSELLKTEQQLAAKIELLEADKRALSALQAELDARQQSVDVGRELSDIERMLGEQMAEAAHQAAAFAANLAIARDNAMAASREFIAVQTLRNRFAGEEVVFGQPVVKVGQGQAPEGETERKVAAALKRLNGGGGRGGSAVDRAAREAERIRNAYESLISTLDPLKGAALEYRDAQAAINEAQKAGIITSEEAARALDLAKERMKDVKGELSEAGEAFKGFFGDALTDIKNVDDALKNLANRLASLAANAAADTLFSSLLGGGDFLSSIFGSANGNVFSGGNVVPFATGGIVNRPTLFPMKNGTGLMGEAGPEAILPLKRGPGGKLGVEAQGGGGMTINVNVAGARGNAEIIEMVQTGVKQGIGHYDRHVVPSRFKAISKDPRRRG